MIDLLIVVVLSLLLVPLASFTTGVLRIALGLLYMLFFPGYALIAALFPRKSTLDGIERLALSFGLNVAVPPLILCILNYTHLGIRLYPILISLLFFIIIMAAIAWYRRWRLPPDERFAPKLGTGLLSMARTWASGRRWDKILSVLLVIVILSAIGTLSYVIATPKVGERFTEFYIMGPERKAENFPWEVTLGEEARVILRIVNREHETIVYKVIITIDAERVGEIGAIALHHEEKWEQEVALAPAKAGPNQKMEFLLYMGAGTEPHRRLHLWMDVKKVP